MHTRWGNDPAPIRLPRMRRGTLWSRWGFGADARRRERRTGAGSYAPRYRGWKALSGLLTVARADVGGVAGQAVGGRGRCGRRSLVVLCLGSSASKELRIVVLEA